MTAPETPAASRARPILLYDGECGLCARSVQFVLARERTRGMRALRFAPLQGEWARAVRASFPVVSQIDTVVWCDTDEAGHARVLLRSDAAIATLRYVGGGWRALAAASALVPKSIRDAVYDVIARRRARLWSRACLLPAEHERERFLP